MMRDGPDPRALDCTNSSEAEAIAATIADWKRLGLKNNEIAIISCYPTSNRPLGQRIQQQLASRHGLKVPLQVIRTRGSKRSLIRKNEIPLLSYASAKGLEFQGVILHGMEWLPEDASPHQLSMFYVGMTRAIQYLVFSWNSPCWLSSKLHGHAPALAKSKRSVSVGAHSRATWDGSQRAESADVR